MARRAFGTGSIWKEKRTGYEVWVGQVRVDRKQHQKVLGRVRTSADGPGIGKTRREAERELQTVRVSLEEKAASDVVEEPRDRARLSVVGEEHCQKLLSRKGVREPTVMDYRQMLAKHLVHFFGDVPLFEITVREVDAFIEHQLQRGSKREEGKGLMPQTVLTHVQLLGAIFNRAVRDGIVTANPVAAAEKPRPKAVEKDIRFLSVEEVEALVRAVRNDKRGKVDAATFVTAAMTGLRRGELIALRWRDIDWAARQVRVRRNRRRGQTTDPKSERSKRSVPMSARVARELDRQFQRSRYRGDDDLVFAHPETGRHYDPDTLTDRFKEARDLAGVPQITFHELRHTFGTRMAAAGVPLRTLMEWMGHAEMKTTMIYAHYAPIEREADLVDAAFAPTAQLTHDVAPSSSSTST